MTAAGPVPAVMIGAGQRGYYAYGPYAHRHPQRLEFVAVAEPDPQRRGRFAADHGLAASAVFDDWRALVAAGVEAEACVVTTPDADHHPATLAALEEGWHVLVEKPLAPTMAQVLDLVRAEAGGPRMVAVAHVLRYTEFFRAVHRVVESGRLGEVVTVEHRENVAAYHMAHSFVRGNWRRTAESSPMILAKCCHDLDLLVWNLAAPVARLASFGSLHHFHPNNAPPGAPPRCTDGCRAAPGCPFDAERIYLSGTTGWPVNAITTDLTPDGIRRALETGPYGRCVYACDNDVVDHQVVAMETVDGTSATLVMHGHSHQEERTMRYDGTRATLRGRFGATSSLQIHDHVTGEVETVGLDSPMSGHGGGDEGVVTAFLDGITGRGPAPAGAATALESHELAFAAEESRRRGTVVDMGDFRRRQRGGAA